MATGTWVCTVCGYVHSGEAPPGTCPVCGAGAEAFEPHAATAATAPSAAAAARWVCSVCGYVHEGDAPPGACPMCGAPTDAFEAAADEAAPPAEAARAAAKDARLVVAGAGIAGVSAAAAFREALPEADIILLSAEDDLPYYRINLTRVLAGETPAAELPLHPASWYDEQRIELRRGVKAAALDPAARRIELETGRALAFDRLVLANGSHPFVPPVEGAAHERVLTLRTAADAGRIIDLAEAGGRAAVIGGGVLGLEAAGGLARRGAEVTLLESHASLMPRQLTPEAGGRLAAFARARGIALWERAVTRSIEDLGGGVRLRLEDGRTLDASFAILATGVRPNTHLARRAGLAVGGGVEVDDRLATAAPGIYAAGDVAEHRGVLYGTWNPARYQGQIAGRNAAGTDTAFGGMPRSVVLKVLGIDLMSIGTFSPPDGSYRVLCDRDDEAYAQLVFRDQRMVGAILLGCGDPGAGARRAVESGRDLSGLLRTAATAAEVLAGL